MKACFQMEAHQMIGKIKAVIEPGDLCFAMLTGTRLSDRVPDTADNIRQVDHAVCFDCIIHLGDILTGNNPREVSQMLLSRELAIFREAVGTKRLFVTAGETDGYRNERFMGQMVHNIMTDDWWHRGTAFIDMYPGVCRPGKKPYYYTDFPDKKLRLVFLFSYTTQIDEELGLFEKYPVLDVEQINWLAKEVLAIKRGWTVLLFSHGLPKSCYETGKNPFVYKGNATEQVLSLLQKAQRRGVQIGGWFAGHYNCDAEAKVTDVNFALTNSVEPQSVLAAGGHFRIPSQRMINTPSQDLWDAVVVKPSVRKIYLFRFGAGEDRVLNFQ